MMRVSFLSLLFFVLASFKVQAQQNKVTEFLGELKHTKSDTGKMAVLFRLSRAYANVGKYDSSLHYANSALAFSEGALKRTSDSSIIWNILHYKAAAFNSLGIANSDMGRYPEAMKYQYESLKLAERIQDKNGISTAYNNIGLTCMAEGKNDEALKNYFVALKINNEIKNARGIAALHNNIGIVYKVQKKFAEALQNHFRAKQIRDSIKDQKGLAYSFTNIGLVYHEMNDFKKGLENHLAALAIREKLEDRSGIAGSLCNIGAAYLGMKNFLQSEQYLLKAHELAEEIGHREFLKQILKGLTTLEMERKNFTKAFQYQSDYYAVRDSINNDVTHKKTLQAQVNYEYEKKEAAQRAQHEKELLVLESENRLQKTTRNYVIVISILLFLLLISAFVYYNIRKSLRVKDAHARQLMTAQEKERQRISKELHDSVGQNVLFIKNQMVKMNELTLMPAIDETLNELRNISKDLYPNQLEKYGLVAAVDSLTEKVHSASGIFASHDMSGLRTTLSPDDQIQYYRIIQECVSNAVKHSGATALRITAERKNDNTVLNIQDNGKGFDKNILARKAQRSFGILNLEERVNYLKGKMEIDSFSGSGTRFTFTIPD